MARIRSSAGAPARLIVIAAPLPRGRGSDVRYLTNAHHATRGVLYAAATVGREAAAGLRMYTLTDGSSTPEDLTDLAADLLDRHQAAVAGARDREQAREAGNAVVRAVTAELKERLRRAQ